MVPGTTISQLFDNKSLITVYQVCLAHIIYHKFETDGIRLSLSFIHEFLKNWTVNTEDESGMTILPETRIFDAIQGFIEFGEDKEPIYLFNGEWYVFDTKYTTALNNEYVFAYENHIKKMK